MVLHIFSTKKKTAFRQPEPFCFLFRIEQDGGNKNLLLAKRQNSKQFQDPSTGGGSPWIGLAMVVGLVMAPILLLALLIACLCKWGICT